MLKNRFRFLVLSIVCVISVSFVAVIAQETKLEFADSTAASEEPIQTDTNQSAEAETATETATTPANDASYLLMSDRKVGVVDKIEVMLEAVGEVTQFLESQESKSNKMEILAGFRYEEYTNQFDSEKAAKLQSVRYYDAARAKIKIGDQLSTPELEAACKVIICDVEGEAATLFSPTGPLKDDQLLLIEDLPANTLLLDQLLPGKEVKIGENWAIPDIALRSLLGLEAIETHDIKAVLMSVKDDIALVEINGDADGAFLGAPSAMNVRVKYQFDLNKKRITWLGLVISEARSLGNVGPAVDLVAKLVLKIDPNVTSTRLADDVVKTLNTERTDERLLARYYSPNKGAWRFLHGRMWYVIYDEPDSTKLRLIDRGELLSQCEITTRPKEAVGVQPKLQSFQEEVRNGLGERFGAMISAKEGKTSRGYHELRLEVRSKKEDEMPLTWLYFLLTKMDGTQVVVAYVIPTENMERFGEQDRQMIDSIELLSK